MGEAPSEFCVEVVRIGEVKKHPNADTLSITEVYGGYPCIFKSGAFQFGQLAVYIPVDSLVPVSRPEFAFLAKPGVERHRIRAVRLRGVFSMGLLVPVGNRTWGLGADVAKLLDVTKYEPPVKGENLVRGQVQRKPGRTPPGMSVYGVEAYRKHKNVLQTGERVVITEKLHGTNARYCFQDGKLWVGSHKTMRGCTRSKLAEWFNRTRLAILSALGRKHRAGLFQEQGDVWWDMAEWLDLKMQLATLPNMTLYGEIIGPGIQKGFDYGLTRKEFVLFDVFDVAEKRWLNFDEMRLLAGHLRLATPPLLYRGTWSDDLLMLADGKTQRSGGSHIREGFVVKADPEREQPGFGRVSLKFVSEAYLLRGES